MLWKIGGIKILIITSMLLILLSIIMSTGGTSYTNGPPSDHTTAYYTLNSPIEITGNDDLAIFSGNGTSTNPYYIGNRKIIGDKFCIRISNTTAYILIKNGIFQGGSEGVIVLENAKNIIIEQCIITRSTIGVIITNTNFTTIYKNNITLCETGVQIQRGTAGRVSYNRIYHNKIGIIFQSTNANTIQGNDVFGNNETGIKIDTESHNNTIIHNNIGWNGNLNTGIISNAADNGQFNKWDDGKDSGNYWSDYDGIGEYKIWGLSNSQDNYPSRLVDDVPPEVVGPSTITMMINDPAIRIEWSLNDLYPGKYYIYNGTTTNIGYWDNEIITITFNPTNIGTFQIQITVLDNAMNEVVDSVSVIVLQENIIERPQYMIAASIFSIIGVISMIIIIKKKF